MAISSISSLASNGVGAGASSVAVQGESAQKNPLAGLSQRSDPSSKTELSLLGRTRLSLEDVQAAAQAARNISNPPTLSDFKVAIQGVVQSLNALNATVRPSSTNGPATSNNVANDPRPSQALETVRRSLQEPDGAARSLLRVGITQNESTFSVNQTALESAFREDRPGSLTALFDIADRVENAADRALNEPPPAPPSPSPISTEEPIEQTQNAEQEVRANQRENFRDLLAAQLANAGSYVARNAVVTYFSVAAL